MNKKLEQLLRDEQVTINAMQAPEQLEEKLRNSLEHIPIRKRKSNSKWKIAAVAAIAGIIIISNQYNAFAYYGKKLLGFDEVINGTLQQLNEAGMGQIIDKSKVLADGTELVIDGVMTDANQFIMFYTLRNVKGLLDDSHSIFQAISINGFLTRSMMSSGVATMNDARTEIKGTITFESVNPFAKKLTLSYFQTLNSGQTVNDSITFPYNPNQAMQTVFKQSIKEKVKVDKGTLVFNTITATPTVTVIEGSLHVDNLRKVDLPLQGIELHADGVLINEIGSGIKSSPAGTTFDLNFDVIPKDVNSLQLVVKRFVGYEQLDQRIDLKSISDEPIAIGEEIIQVADVQKTDRGIEVMIVTTDQVRLEGVSIVNGTQETELETTINQEYVEKSENSLMKKRTLVFNTSTMPEYLQIDGMHYMKTYDKTIDIPVK